MAKHLLQQHQEVARAVVPSLLLLLLDYARPEGYPWIFQPVSLSKGQGNVNFCSKNASKKQSTHLLSKYSACYWRFMDWLSPNLLIEKKEVEIYAMWSSYRTERGRAGRAAIPRTG